MRAVLDSGREVSWSAAQFPGFRHGYAGTIYKGQGKTLDHTYLYHTHHWRQAASYVALTRQRESAQVFVARETARATSELARQMARGEVKALPSHGRRARSWRRRRSARPSQPLRAAARREPVSPQEIAKGRARFRERYQAHRQAAERDTQARDLVASWDRLARDYNRALPGLEADPTALDDARAQLLRFGAGLRDQPEVVRALRERGAEFGLDERKNLLRVLADPQPQRAIDGMMGAAEAHMRAQLRERAEKAAARERETAAKRPRQTHGLGMGR